MTVSWYLWLMAFSGITNLQAAVCVYQGEYFTFFPIVYFSQYLLSNQEARLFPGSVYRKS